MTLAPDAVAAFLARIGATRPAGPTVDALHALHVAHLDAVPFENLSVPLGEQYSLDLDALVDKIVRRRRGGFCYELNGLFGAVLTDLGYGVDLLGAQVWSDGGWGPPLDHLSLGVTCDDGSRWLVDVGFGAYFRLPKSLTSGDEQPDGHGRFRLAVDDDTGDVVVHHDGRPVTRQEMRPRVLPDFAAMCWFQTTSPDAGFSHRLTCSLPTPGGRVSLSGNRLIVTQHGDRTETVLTDDHAVLDAYRTHFGIVLDEVPRLD